MNGHEMELFQRLRSYANMLVDQTYRRLAEGGVSLQAPPVDPNIDLHRLLRNASEAHNQLANFRAAVPQTEWERVTVDGRTGEYIFEELSGVLHQLVSLDHELATS